MKESDIILTPISQADGIYKNRPCLILKIMPKYKDFLVCGISSQLQRYIKNFDQMILTTDSDFSDSGLKQSSVIRLGFLAVIPSKRVLGKIGSISEVRHELLLNSLSDYLTGNLNLT